MQIFHPCFLPYVLPQAPAGRARFARVIVLLGAAAFGWVLLAAQAYGQSPAAPGPQSQPVYSSMQLDQMLAPIALYPDDLLGQILMASTYPLEIVQADRWLQNPTNASLRGMPLAQALQQEPWDASVKSLVAYPQILSVMDGNLDWTEQLGDAFLAQQADVMDSVQRLRGRAQAARTLVSTPQQTVANNDQAIEIAPAGPDAVYVPVYDPDVIYGDWPYPDYLPYYFDVPGYPIGSYIGFSIVVPFWGWNHWNWNQHGLNIVGGAGAATGGRFPPMRTGPWQHDPAHRGGVPYRDPVTRARFEGAAEMRSMRSEFRGYFPAETARAPTGLPATRYGATAPEPVHAPGATPAMPRAEAPRYAPAPVERASPPALESFGRGADVHAQEQRGASSRTSAPSGGGKGYR